MAVTPRRPTYYSDRTPVWEPVIMVSIVLGSEFKTAQIAATALESGAGAAERSRRVYMWGANFVFSGGARK